MYTISETVLPIYNNGRFPLIKTCSDVPFMLSSDCSTIKQGGHNKFCTN